MSLDEERLRQIRENAGFAIEQFSAITGTRLGLDRDGVAWVEGFVERQRARDGEVSGGLVSVIGSFLGEAIIAGTGGAWVEDDAGGLGVRFANGDTVYPFAKVRKQFDQGVEAGESLASFYDVSVDYVATGKLRHSNASAGDAQ